jgi:uncharacterized protein YkuJ
MTTPTKYTNAQLIALINRLKGMLQDIDKLNQQKKYSMATGLAQGGIAFLKVSGF